MKYYGYIPKGRNGSAPFAEVLATKERGKASTDVETGVTYSSVKDADAGVLAKNIALHPRP